jgi:hypothetical protein
MSVLRNTLKASVFTAFLGLSTASMAVAACDLESAIFADDFEFMDVSWGDPDDKLFVKDGVLVVKGGLAHVNFTTQNQGGNVCADITITEAPDPTLTAAGVVFWWKDWDNYYFFYSWPDGSVEMRRVLKRKMTVIFSIKAEMMKTGVGQTNNFELLLKPKDATLFINGQQVKRFKGVQPKDGGAVGIIAGSPEEKPGAFAFDNLVVSPPADQPVEE